jgi:hypothetical protein
VLTDELTNISVQNLKTGENELTNISVQITNRSVQFKTDVDAIKDELTHRSVHLSP